MTARYGRLPLGRETVRDRGCCLLSPNKLVESFLEPHVFKMTVEVRRQNHEAAGE
jgi:hypothetical protein